MRFSAWKTACRLWKAGGDAPSFSAHCDEPRLCLYLLDPTPDLWKIVQWKAAFVGDVRIGEERDVCDRVIADKEIIFTQVFFHNSKRGPAAVAPSGENCVAFGGVRLVL